jgi:thiol-disulfide isomerase/thioredoxin
MWIAGAWLQSGAQPSTPQDCVRAGREFSSRRQAESRPLTVEIVRKIDGERVDMVRSCGVAFDVEKAHGRELAGLVELYSESAQPQLAERAIARGLEDGALTPLERAELLANAIRALLRQPKGAERNARAENYLDLLDALPDEALDHKLTAHIALNNYYRADDIDVGIIKHSTWLIEKARRLSAEQRKRVAGPLTNAYVNLAEAYAGQGDNDRALDLLRRVPTDLPDLPDVEKRTKSTLDRYLLVGTKAAAIAAPTWLNRQSDASNPLELTDVVTYLQFTAHWCGPCKESYPGLQRLRQRFAGRPFEVVLATQLYGYFESERNLAPEQEIARDREYFKKYKLDVPIAISQSARSVVDGKPTYTPEPNEAAYKVGGIPQIQLIDARGRIRLIMVGYDDANEEKFAAFIEKLLSEMKKSEGA